MLPEFFAPCYLIAHQEQMRGWSVLCHLLFSEERVQILGNGDCVRHSSLRCLRIYWTDFSQSPSDTRFRSVRCRRSRSNFSYSTFRRDIFFWKDLPWICFRARVDHVSWPRDPPLWNSYLKEFTKIHSHEILDKNEILYEQLMHLWSLVAPWPWPRHARLPRRLERLPSFTFGWRYSCLLLVGCRGELQRIKKKMGKGQYP